MPRTTDAGTSPPAALGSVAGLGETFRMNLNTGQGVYSYTLPLPDGVAKHTPKLSLEYAHGNRQGPYGFGWRLHLRAIERRLDFGTSGDVAATFLDDGKELVALADGSFAARSEGAFDRYVRAGDGWRIEARDGAVFELGMNPAARIADPADPSRVQSWLLERHADVHGNAMTYAWDVSDGFAYPREVRYAAYAVRFAFEDRPDVRRDGRAGFVRVLRKRCARATLVLDPGLPAEAPLRSWTFGYDIDATSAVSMLTSVQLRCVATADTEGGDVVRPAVRFAYGAFDPRDVALGFYPAEGGEPPPLDDPDTALVVLDDAPLPGLLQIVNGKQWYRPNTGSGFGPPRPLPDAPFAGSIGTSGAAFVDLNGNGRADLMLLAPDSVRGYYENGGRHGWDAFVAFPRNSSAQPDWTGGRLRFADADADGRADALETVGRGLALWRNQGERGWSAPLVLPRPGDVDFADPLVVLADMTGDGASDLVEIESGRVRYRPGLGNGRFGDPVEMANAPRLRDVLADPQRVLLADVDGDGCADLIYVRDDALVVVSNRNGAAFAEPVEIAPIPAPLPNTIRAMNLRGGATMGLVWNSVRSAGRVEYVHVEFAPSGAPYLLAGVDNGAGLVSELFYRSAVEDYLDDRARGTPWTTNFPFPMRVVARTRETDRVTGSSSVVRYRYHEAHYEPHGRRFEGFRTAERIEVGDESRADTRTVHQFLMAMERMPGNGPEHAALNGALARVDVYQLDGTPDEPRPLSTETSDYALAQLRDTADGSARSLVTVAKHVALDVERTDDVRGEEKTYAYDARGEVVRETRRGFGTQGGVAQPELLLTTELTYATSAAHRVFGKPASVVVRDAGGAIVSETRTFYDGADFVGLPLGTCDRGLVTRRLRLAWSQGDFAAHYDNSMGGAAALGFVAGDDAAGAAAQFVAHERFAYDARGLKTGEMDPLGATSAIAYDADGLFRVQLHSALGDTAFVYDRGAGQPSRVTYPGGEVARFRYDAQGRVLVSLTPVDDPAHPPRRYRFDETVVPNVRITTLLQAADGSVASEVRTYFDGRGNEVEHRAQVDATRFVVSGRRAFNPWGDLKAEHEPVFAADAAFSQGPPAGPVRTMTYDARGRVVRTVNYNGGVSTARFRPFAVELSDANDNDASPANAARGQAQTPRRELLDVFRQRTAIVDVLSPAETKTTTFAIDAYGTVVEIRDALGTLCRYACDKLGNRYRVEHRDAGTRKLWYDARQRVVRSLDAAGNDLRVTMDVVGRLQRVSSAATVLEEYTYENAGAGATGRLAKVVYGGGSQTLAYDGAGRQSRIEYRFDGTPAVHSIAYEYDVLGRQTGALHSDGTHIAQTLTFNGWVRGVGGVLDRIDYDPRGVPAVLAYANGVTTTLTYGDGPARVATRKTTGPHGELYEDVTNTFDLMGMLVTGSDAAPAGRGTASYAYDPLYQLASYAFGDPHAPTVRTYTYANHQNLTRMDESGAAFAYDDAAHPDRMTGITVGAGPRSDLAYDANGNLLGLPGRRFAYDEKNQLARVTRDDGTVATYAYDPRGLRVAKSVTTGGVTTTTFFVGTGVEIRNGKTTHLVTLERRRVAILTDGPARFVHTDETGNTLFFSSATGAKIASIVYRPFGNVERTDGAVDQRTYGLHPFDDESGLYAMRRRWYAPEIARFTTPDPYALYQPHKVLQNPKALHPYAYAGGDPLDNVDYDGLSFWSVVGAIVGVIVAVALAVAVVALSVVTCGAFAVALGIVLAIGIVSVSYVVAKNNAGTGVGEFFRGFMIGFNAGLNAIIATAIFGPVIGITLGVINFLAAFDSIAGNKVYQGILGWASWIMPMSWLATAVGLIFFAINLIAAAVTGNSGAAKIDRIGIHWETGTLVMEGGLIHAFGSGIAFNLGNVAFLNSGHSDAELHETGHALGVAAFGSIFHFVGAIEQAADTTNHTSYSEHLAESHDPAKLSDPETQHMWG